MLLRIIFKFYFLLSHHDLQNYFVFLDTYHTYRLIHIDSGDLHDIGKREMVTIPFLSSLLPREVPGKV